MKPLAFEMFAGGGTLGFAFEAGARGVSFSGASELSPQYLQAWSAHRPEADTFGGDITAFHPAEVSPARNGAAMILLAGIPCTGASLAGRSKNKLSCAEEHAKAGHLFIPTLLWIRTHKPEAVVFENVPAYAKSASARSIRDVLSTSGYFLFETVLDAHQNFSTPSRRKRWVMVATRNRPFHMDVPVNPFVGTLDDYLDPESPDDVVFTEAQVAGHAKYIARKQSENCGWKTTILERDSNSCPTIVRTYYKVQPVGPFVRCKNSYRMLRPREIARLHGFPTNLPLPDSNSKAIEILGQGVCFAPFAYLGEKLAAFFSEIGKPIQIRSANQQMDFAF